MSRVIRLGVFIFAALLIFGAAVFLIGEKQFLFSPTYRLKANFDNVAGLDVGAPVRAGGVRIGTVEKIQLPRRPNEKVVIEMQLEDATQSVIRKDSVAAIETEGLLGSKYLEISFGSAQGESLRDGDTLQTRPPLDYADIARKAGNTIESAKQAIDSAKEAIDMSKSAIGNLTTATGDVKDITSKINSGEGTIGAFVNDRRTFDNINAMTGSLREVVDEAKTGVVSFQENMEALKHNFLLRGFFKDRGYFDSADLTRYAIDRLPEGAPSKKFVITSKDLFDKPDNAKLDKEKLLNEAGKYLEGNDFGFVVIVAYTGSQGAKEENLKLSQARAAVVRQYLAETFKIDDSRIRTLGLGESTQGEIGKDGVLEILIYSRDVVIRTAEAKAK
jgi:phospholipid/cholesterol/gamma-HCH transport system substrate-binding protein